ncbi:uncharacterized protein QC763_0083880 [Podospora pseudopauciseta]|uniref:Uncharacterized protein n=1 Tax=Podospora pseudopauciseta TaxID=2093780 RepID=A0ABR0H8B4_9PEZI|nr:hypothetical protein QC763_0083880 [Podospora pseudopauciseta]
MTEKVITDASSFLGQGCEMLDKIEEDITAYKGALELKTTKELVGYDAHGCKAKKGKTCGKPIVCPISAGFKDKCIWRGSGGDCNGQCREGEIKIAGSSWGGSPGESGTNRCSRGAASTARPTRKKVAYATDIHEKCWKHDESLKKRNGSITLPSSLHKRWGRTVGNDYCCPKNKPVPYKKCHWVGSKDCAVPNCERHEIFLATNDYGDADYYPCNLNEESLNPVAECNSEICSVLDGGGCSDPDEGETDDGADYPNRDGPSRDTLVVASRAIAAGSSAVRGQTWYAYGPEPLNDSDDEVDGTLSDHTGVGLEARVPSSFGVRRSMTVVVKTLAGSSAAGIKGAGNLIMKSMKYRTGPRTFEGPGSETLKLKAGFGMAKDVCDGTVAQWWKQDSLPALAGKLRYDAEHLLDFSIMPAWARTGLSSGELNPQVLLDVWHKAYPENIHLAELGAIVTDVKGWTPPVTPNDRMFTIMG